MQIAAYIPFSLSDYPGKVSAIVFTQGCNFRCPYCHNPGLVETEGSSRIDIQQLLTFLEKRKDRLQAVVISGGEPTLQKELIPFVRTIKSMGYLIKLDTNGSRPDVIEEMLTAGLVDYIAMDIKAPLRKYHTVGGCNVELENIGKSIRLIQEAPKISYQFRTTVVKSQLSTEDLMDCAGMIEGANLYILQKFDNRKSLDQKFENETSYTEDEFSQIRKRLSKKVKQCCVR